jgi:hypothetical protein
MVAVSKTIRVPGSGACPESGYAVVGARGEDVSDRVPVERPDSKVVGVTDAVRRVDYLGWRSGRVGAVPRGESVGSARRGIRFVKEIMEEAAIGSASS